MRQLVKEFTKGLWTELPPFRLVLGLCPTLAVTKTADNGLGMGLAVIFGLEKCRVPGGILLVIIAISIIGLIFVIFPKVRHFLAKAFRKSCCTLVRLISASP